MQQLLISWPEPRDCTTHESVSGTQEDRSLQYGFICFLRFVACPEKPAGQYALRVSNRPLVTIRPRRRLCRTCPRSVPTGKYSRFGRNGRARNDARHQAAAGWSTTSGWSASVGVRGSRCRPSNRSVGACGPSMQTTSGVMTSPGTAPMTGASTGCSTRSMNSPANASPSGWRAGSSPSMLSSCWRSCSSCVVPQGISAPTMVRNSSPKLFKSGLSRSAPRRHLHHAWQSVGERLCREFQRAVA